MTGIFRQKNSSNALLLVVYGMILKFSFFLEPEGILHTPGDRYLFNVLANFLESIHLPLLMYPIITFTLLYLQATLFNRICNAQKMMPKSNYLPAMSYMLITSLLSECNRFSAALLINSLLIWAFYRMILLYNSQKPGSAVFNIGVVMGIATLLYNPAIVFVILILLALYIMRPFILQEWVIALIGATTPYYFLGILLFLNNQWSWKNILPDLHFSLPVLPSSIYTTISFGLLLLPFIIGGYYLQNNLSKMLIQVRKNWSLLLLFLVISTLVIPINSNDNYINWMLCMVPLSAFHGAAWFYPPVRIFPAVLHWIIFTYAMYINYFL